MTDLRDQLSRSLEGAYSISEEIGGGGMSRVFHAEEIALGRRVVIKVLPVEQMSSASASRFKREISLAAKLQHPHIVPLLSAGETDGAPYFTMPLIEGESLRKLLERRGRLESREALRILRDVASAIAYAHSKGIVHRDIKPENILLTREHAIVADFGVAKALSAATEGDSVGLTSVGIALGTPAYMSPEQAAGDPNTDYRADLYGFGVVAYELLSGNPPFSARSPQALIAAHITERPAPLSRQQPNVSPALAKLVMRCLEKNPAERPPSAEHVLGQLDLIAQGAGTTSARPSIAVLPLSNTSGDPGDEHFSDGLTDELIGTLGKLPEISVSGRTSVFALRSKGLGIREIADALHVTHILEGSVRRSGDRIKVRVQLADDDGRVLWSESYDRKLHDVFAVQEEIATAVVSALEIRLATGRRPTVRPLTTNLTAYDLYLKGKFVLRRLEPNDLDRAIQFFEQAVALDSSFAAAYAWLCNTHLLRVVFAGRPALEELERARHHADSAVAADDALSDAHWAMGEILLILDLDWSGAGRELDRALALDPGHADARHIKAITLLAQRRFEEANAELSLVISTDPLLADANMTMGRLLLAQHQADRGLEFLEDALRIAPAFSFARGYVGHAYIMKEMIDRAIEEFERGNASGVAVDSAQLAYAYAIAGRREDAHRLIDAILADSQRYPPPFHIAMAYTGLGDKDKAFEWLNRALVERVPFLTGQVAIEPAFESLHNDPRFRHLLEKMRLDAGWI